MKYTKINGMQHLHLTQISSKRSILKQTKMNRTENLPFGIGLLTDVKQDALHVVRLVEHDDVRAV